MRKETKLSKKRVNLSYKSFYYKPNSKIKKNIREKVSNKTNKTDVIPI